MNRCTKWIELQMQREPTNICPLVKLVFSLRTFIPFCSKLCQNNVSADSFCLWILFNNTRIYPSLYSSILYIHWTFVFFLILITLQITRKYIAANSETTISTNSCTKSCWLLLLSSGLHFSLYKFRNKIIVQTFETTETATKQSRKSSGNSHEKVQETAAKKFRKHRTRFFFRIGKQLFLATEAYTYAKQYGNSHDNVRINKRGKLS